MRSSEVKKRQLYLLLFLEAEDCQKNKGFNEGSEKRQIKAARKK
jgi:hypothetical protein